MSKMMIHCSKAHLEIDDQVSVLVHHAVTTPLDPRTAELKICTCHFRQGPTLQRCLPGAYLGHISATLECSNAPKSLISNITRPRASVLASKLHLQGQPSQRLYPI